MSGYINDKKKSVSPCLRCVIYALLVLLMAGCGDGSSTSNTAGNAPAEDAPTGSATFSVQWQTDRSVSASAPDATPRNAIEDCATAGIETITCMVCVSGIQGGRSAIHGHFNKIHII
jgi:hypothetical protein